MTAIESTTSYFGEYNSLLSHSGITRLDASARAVDATSQYDGYCFIALLGLVQRLEIELLPPTWQLLAGSIGKGGQATINHAALTSQHSLALKTFDNSLNDPFRAVVQEMVVLSHPAVRSHDHIVRLEGISFEISSEDEVWPILVFRKTQLGDFNQFVETERSRHLSIEDKLNLCFDVGVALSDMHKNRNDSALRLLFESKTYTDIIHGDIKPGNILIFEDDSRITAKVADFGCSTHFQSDEAKILLPKSEPWNAPEIKGQTFRPLQARQIDIYSFALLCIWLLLEVGSSRSTGDTDEAFVSFAQYKAEKNMLRQLKASDDDPLIAWAKSLLSGHTCLDSGMKENMSAFFEDTLTFDPQSRCTDLPRLLSLLNPRRNTSVRDAIHIGPAPEEEIFELPRSFVELYDFDYRLRVFIVESLELIARKWKEPLVQRVSPAKAALQMILSCDIGFGNSEDYKQALLMLAKNSIEPEHVRAYMRERFGAPHQGTNLFPPSDTLFSQLRRAQIPQSINFTDYYRQRNLLAAAEEDYVQSITALEELFDGDNALALKLQSRLAAIMTEQRRWDEAEKLYAHVAEKASKLLGEEHHLTLSCRANLADIAYIKAAGQMPTDSSSHA